VSREWVNPFLGVRRGQGFSNEILTIFQKLGPQVSNGQRGNMSSWRSDLI